MTSADTAEYVLLVLLMIGAAIALLVYTIKERSQGAERRATRRRRARRATRAERDIRNKIAEKLPVAVASSKPRR